ncbi:MAG: glycosyltransferase family 4 protein [Candidatus Hodarchaeota archaeon]
MELTDASLTLFFTRGMTLKTWEEIGLIDRELAIYRKLSNSLKTLNIVTYGGDEDKEYIDKLDGLRIFPAIWFDKQRNTIRYLLEKYRPDLQNSAILKTNQIPGSEIPLWFKEKFGNKLIVRCGYLYTRNTIKGEKGRRAIKKAIQLEKKAFMQADLGIVTSEWQRDIIIDHYNLRPEKVKVVPNYVVTDVFKPSSEIQKEYDLVYVGRGGTEKNLENLIKAINYLKSKKRHLSLVLIGRCCFDDKIKQITKKYQLNVLYKGNVPNFDLPNILNQAKVFILPSYYEGHPKTLLEAMSCALPCIGTNVTGIKEDIEHLVTGYLCETDYMSIAKAIESLLTDEFLRIKLSRNARDYVVKNYSIDRIFQLELKAIQELLNS